MSEPTERDKEVAWEHYDLLCNDTMLEGHERIVAAYRRECERLERERVIAVLEACSPFDTMSDVIARLRVS